ncbi:F-box/LRR-repeat protein 25-like protein [Tanacetum coccineum]
MEGKSSRSWDLREENIEQDRRNTSRFSDLREESRLSLLPDFLIAEILSRLESTKEVIRTSVLSKRWINVWTLAPNLFFDVDLFAAIRQNLPIQGFCSFIDQTISQCPLNINKFQIFIRYFYKYEPSVNYWVHYAINHKVKEFHLLIPRLYPQFGFVLPQLFFINSSFTILKLDGCIFNPSSITWKNLKSLSISNAKLDHDLIQNILSGSPLLETFKLHLCYGFTLIDIPSKSVKHLVFSGFRDPKQTRRTSTTHAIEINAPYILSLAVEDLLCLYKLSLLNVSSLIKAELNYTKRQYFYEDPEVAEEEMLKAVILSLRHVKELTIGESCLKVALSLSINY